METHIRLWRVAHSELSELTNQPKGNGDAGQILGLSLGFLTSELTNQPKGNGDPLRPLASLIGVFRGPN